MKYTALILSSIGLFWASTNASAQTQAEPLCKNVEACFAMNEKMLPSGNLQNYPNYASLPQRFNTGGERAFVFSPRHKMWAAYDSDGYLVASGKANGGAAYCPDIGRPCRTPGGTFRVRSKGSPSCVSSKFPVGVGGAAMPYCMFFHGGYAIHGSPYISNRNGSHGCIRVRTSAAKWLSHNFMRGGTKVVVLPY